MDNFNIKPAERIIALLQANLDKEGIRPLQIRSNLSSKFDSIAQGKGFDYSNSSSRFGNLGTISSSSSSRVPQNYSNSLYNGPPTSASINFGRPSILGQNYYKQAASSNVPYSPMRESGNTGYESDTTVQYSPSGNTGYESDTTVQYSPSGNTGAMVEEGGGFKRSRKRRINKHNSKKRGKNSKGRKTRKVRRVRKVQKSKPKPKPKRRSLKRKVQRYKSKKRGKNSKLLKTKKRGIRRNTRRKH
jgi:hypothetical protein